MGLDESKRPSRAYLLVGLLLSLLGLGFAGAGIWSMRGALADREWRATDAQIEKVTIGRHHAVVSGPRRSSLRHTVQVTYRYEVDGKPIRASRYTGDEAYETFTEQAEAEARADELRRTGRLTVYYDPATPTHAVIERRSLLPPIGVAIIGGVVLLLGIGFVLAYRSKLAAGGFKSAG